MVKTLFLREMGMDYNNPAVDGVKNHRVRVLENIDIVFEGEVYNLFFEFLQVTKYTYRTINKRTGKELKHPVKELVNANGIMIDTQFERPEKDSFGRVWNMSYRLGKFESEIWNDNLDYTKKAVLEIVNRYSTVKYNKVVLIEETAKEIISRIGGYREKDIIADSWTYCTINNTTWNEEHKVVRFIKRKKVELSKGVYQYQDDTSCDVDIVTGRIVG